MKIYGFNNGGISYCGEDTRFMSDDEVITKIKNQIEYSKSSLKKLEEDMTNFAKLSKDYRYDLNFNVGRCFIEMDIIKQEVKRHKDMLSQIKTNKDLK